ncbi:phosphoribosyl-ATP diphosphatase [Treponema sp. R6D11]
MNTREMLAAAPSKTEEAKQSVFELEMAQIADRKANPKEKSYTNYLLDQGIDKVCKKIGEEAAEVIIEIKNGDKEKLIEEIADLAFNIEVAMFMQGVTIDDVRNKIAERLDKKQNLKTFNNKGAI